MPLPDADTRRDILTIVTRKTPVAPDVSLEDLVSRTERFSGAEVALVCVWVLWVSVTVERREKVVRVCVCVHLFVCVCCVYVHVSAYVCVFEFM